MKIALIRSSSTTSQVSLCDGGGHSCGCTGKNELLASTEFHGECMQRSGGIFSD